MIVILIPGVSINIPDIMMSVKPYNTCTSRAQPRETMLISNKPEIIGMIPKAIKINGSVCCTEEESDIHRNVDLSSRCSTYNATTPVIVTIIPIMTFHFRISLSLGRFVKSCKNFSIQKVEKKCKEKVENRIHKNMKNTKIILTFFPNLYNNEAKKYWDVAKW